MTPALNRRQFIDRVCVTGAFGAAAGSLSTTAAAAAQAPSRDANDLKYPKPSKDGLGDPFPSQDPVLVQEIVGASHGNLARVAELVKAVPMLAKASWDWGFGDWETALGAASHTGRREIAELLLANGAPPTIFSAAMLGQLEVVQALIAASPGIERQLGPHSIPLLAHARAGGEKAAAVLKYLESLNTPTRLAPAPLESADRAALPGRYVFGPGPRDAFIVDEEREQLGIRREGATRRGLRHLGSLEFSPPGADDVRIRFVREAAGIVQLTVAGINATNTAAIFTARKGSGSA